VCVFTPSHIDGYGVDFFRMSHLAGETRVDLDQLRARLHRMSDANLIRFGGAAKYMTSPEANLGEPPRPEFVVQLREAREEYKRRRNQKFLNF
jgi:hypothetical protein